MYFCFHERCWTAPSYFFSLMLAKDLYCTFVYTARLFVVAKCTVDPPTNAAIGPSPAQRCVRRHQRIPQLAHSLVTLYTTRHTTRPPSPTPHFGAGSVTAGGRCAAWLRSAGAAAGGAAVHAEPRERRGARRPRGDDVVRGRRHADARGQLVPQPQEHRRQRGLRHQLRPNDRPRRARHRRLPARRPGESAGVGCSRARVQIAAATLSGNSLRQTVHTHRASVHQAAKLAAALLRRKVMAAYRRVCDSRHLQADCQEPRSAPEPYAL